jgi:alpha-glucosidase
MPWSPQPGLGFTTAPTAWLPFGDRTPTDTVAVQQQDPTSSWATHRRLLATRTRTAHLRDDTLAWFEVGDVTAYRTGNLLVAANLTERPQQFHPGPGTWHCEFDTDTPEPRTVPRELAPTQAVILTVT